MLREAHSGNYAEVVNNFKSMLNFNRIGDIQSFSPTGDWTLVGDLYGCKMVATSQSEGLFLKIYPNDYWHSTGYAKTAYQTLQDLGKLTGLQYPVLLPVALEEDVLVFEKGKHKQTLNYGGLDQNTKNNIASVVERNGLKSFGSFNKIPIVTLKNIDYITDPFDDSALRIGEYAEKIRNAAERAKLSDEVSKKTISEARDFVDEVRRRDRDKYDNSLKGGFGHAVRVLATEIRNAADGELSPEEQRKILIKEAQELIKKFGVEIIPKLKKDFLLALDESDLRVDP
jgi:hypothetical protein